MPPFDQVAGLASAALRDCALLPTTQIDGSGELFGEVMHVVVEAEGAPAARLTLSAAAPLAALIAAGMLGDRSDDAETYSQPDGALRELANVLARRLLAHFFGSSHDVGVPTLQPELPSVEPGATSCVVRLLTESGHPLRIDWVTRCARP